VAAPEVTSIAQLMIELAFTIVDAPDGARGAGLSV
jgi:hypothetical protein